MRERCHLAREPPVSLRSVRHPLAVRECVCVCGCFCVCVCAQECVHMCVLAYLPACEHSPVCMLVSACSVYNAGGRASRNREIDGKSPFSASLSSQQALCHRHLHCHCFYPVWAAHPPSTHPLLPLLPSSPSSPILLNPVPALLCSCLGFYSQVVYNNGHMDSRGRGQAWVSCSCFGPHQCRWECI